MGLWKHINHEGINKMNSQCFLAKVKDSKIPFKVIVERFIRNL